MKGHITSIFASLFISLVAIAAADNSQRLVLSPSFAIYFPNGTKDDTQLGYMPAQGGFWIEGKAGDRAYEAWITRRRPRTIPNEAKVKKFWQDNLNFTKKLGEEFKDLGCHKMQANAFRCDRTSQSKLGHFVAEALFWNGRTDLVVVRVMQNNSLEIAQAILQGFNFRIQDKAAVAKK